MIAALLIKPEDQDARDEVASQVNEYQSWFDANLAYFDCSDPFIRKMYYHRAYVLRKNMLDPKLGRLQCPTQSEGPVAEHLVSQRHQLWRGPPGA